MKALTSHVWRDHVALGAVVATGPLPFLGPWGAFEFWLASILIDLDRYLHFLYATRFKDWSFRGMFQFHHHLFPQRHRPDFLAIEVFHTIEFIFLIGTPDLVLSPGLEAGYSGECYFIWEWTPSIWPGMGFYTNGPTRLWNFGSGKRDWNKRGFGRLALPRGSLTAFPRTL